MIEEKNKYYTEDSGIDLDTYSKEEEIAKFKDIKAVGWNILVRLYTAPKKTKGGIIMTDQTQDEQKYSNCTGLVVRVSDHAYKDKRYKDTSSWCKEGDWVVFARHAGYRIAHKNMPVFVLKEDAIDLIIKDPRTISR